MSIENILVAGFTVLISIVAFFLADFKKMVNKLVDDVGNMRETQAGNTEKLNQLERRLHLVEQKK